MVKNTDMDKAITTFYRRAFALERAKLLKKIIRRYRAQSYEHVRLCDILINIKSHYMYDAQTVMKSLKPILLDKSLHREYGIKTQVLRKYGKYCFSTEFQTLKRGNKTYYANGHYYSHDAEMMQLDGLPF